MTRRTRMLLTALLGSLYVALVVLSVLSLTWTVIVGVFVLAGEWHFFNARNLWIPHIVQRVFSDSFRLITLELVVVFAVVRAMSDHHELRLMSLMVLTVLIRALKIRYSQLMYAKFETRLAWRNLKVERISPVFHRNFLTESHTRELLAEAAVILGASAFTVVLQSSLLLGWVLIGLVVTRGAVVLYFAVIYLRHSRDLDLVSRQDARVKSALQKYEPEVVLYLAGASQSANVINVWVSTFERMKTKSVIVVRGRRHLEQINTKHLPVLFLPTEQELSSYLPTTAVLTLYPSNSADNADMLQQPGVFDVFIGHGDSDKSASANPVSRVYDEIWVAGPAAVERYLKADIGIDPVKLREVGRPQLVDIREAFEMQQRDKENFTVLYAPTWEGISLESSYTSMDQGKEIIKALLGMENVRVLFKPHPAIGYRDARYKDIEYEIIHMLHHADGDHQTVTDLNGLYDAFNEADLLLTDISSVITDFLYSYKPYIVTNPHDLKPAEFFETYPSASAAWLLQTDAANLEDIIEDARTTDTLRNARIHLSHHLLGASRANPVKRFEKVVRETIKQQRQRQNEPLQ